MKKIIFSSVGLAVLSGSVCGMDEKMSDQFHNQQINQDKTVRVQGHTLEYHKCLAEYHACWYALWDMICDNLCSGYTIRSAGMYECAVKAYRKIAEASKALVLSNKSDAESLEWIARFDAWLTEYDRQFAKNGNRYDDKLYEWVHESAEWFDDLDEWIERQSAKKIAE